VKLPWITAAGKINARRIPIMPRGYSGPFDLVGADHVLRWVGDPKLFAPFKAHAQARVNALREHHPNSAAEPLGILSPKPDGVP